MTDQPPDEGDAAHLDGDSGRFISIAGKVPPETKAEVRMIAAVNNTNMSKWVGAAIEEKLARTPDRIRELARELARERQKDEAATNEAGRERGRQEEQNREGNESARPGPMPSG